MPTVLEKIDNIQYITNKSGEKTAIIIPLEDKDEDFRRLLTEFVEFGDIKKVDSLISVEKNMNTITTLINRIEDPVFLERISDELQILMEEADDRLDLIMIAKRSSEERVSHEDLKEELKADGLI